MKRADVHRPHPCGDMVVVSIHAWRGTIVHACARTRAHAYRVQDMSSLFAAAPGFNGDLSKCIIALSLFDRSLTIAQFRCA